MFQFTQNETNALRRRIFFYASSPSDGYTNVTTGLGVTTTVEVTKNGVLPATIPLTPAFTHVSSGLWYYEMPSAYLDTVGIITVTIIDASVMRTVQAVGYVYAGDPLSTSSSLTSADIWSYTNRTLTGSLDPTAAQIADAVWDEAYADHKAAGTFGKLMDTLRKSNYVTEGTVTSAVTATTTTFSTNLTNEDGSLDHQSLLFLTGDHIGTSIPVLNYSLANGLVQLEETLHAPPVAGDEFVILPQHVHSVIGIAAGVWNGLSTSYNTVNTFGNILKTLQLSNYSTTGSVTSALSATNVTFSTTLTNETGALDHQSLVFITGDHIGTSIPILTYQSTNGAVTLEEPLHQPPGVGDSFVILPHHVHAISAIADGILNRLLDSSDSSVDAFNERTVRSALRAMRNKVSVNSGTMVVYKENDTDAAWEGTVSNTADVIVNPDGGD